MKAGKVLQSSSDQRDLRRGGHGGLARGTGTVRLVSNDLRRASKRAEENGLRGNGESRGTTESADANECFVEDMLAVSAGDFGFDLAAERG